MRRTCRRSPHAALEYMTRLCEHAWDTLAPLPDEAVARGLRDIFSNGSDYPDALLNENLGWAARQRCIRSIYHLFPQYFSAKCRPKGPDPLDDVCFMWWDVYPLAGDPAIDPAFARVDRELVEVMGSTLGLDSEACWYSALHALGHWQVHHPARVAALVDGFLMQHPEIDPKLREYALAPREGDVL